MVPRRCVSDEEAWSIVRTVALLAIALGAISFALALVMDADLVRIADTVFSNYDLAKVIVSLETHGTAFSAYLACKSA